MLRTCTCKLMCVAWSESRGPSVGPKDSPGQAFRNEGTWRPFRGLGAGHAIDRAKFLAWCCPLWLQWRGWLHSIAPAFGVGAVLGVLPAWSPCRASPGFDFTSGSLGGALVTIRLSERFPQRRHDPRMVDEIVCVARFPRQRNRVGPVVESW